MRSVRRTALVLVVPLVLLAAGVVAPAQATGLYGSTARTDIAIPMRDGIKLVGDVLYPTDARTGERAKGRFPVLLAQTPYSCDTAASNLGFAEQGSLGASYYVQRGYVFASVCVRGTGRSGGDFDLWGPVQQRDGVELVRWAVSLNGSNGTVGLIGCSYVGMNQLFTAAALPPNSGVKAMVPACAGAETYRVVGMAGGIPTETATNYFNSLGVLAGPRAGVWGSLHAKVIASGGTMAYDNAWSKERTPANWVPQIARSGIPALLWSSYDDMYLAGAQELYAYLQNAYFGRPVYGQLLPGQRTTPRYQVVIGTGGHGDGIDQKIVLDWFDTWLKGKHTGMERTKTPMHLYQLGTGRWVDTAAYPAVRSYTPYYLGKSGNLGTKRAKGTAMIRYAAPSTGAVLTYTTTAFRRSVELAGPVAATVVASSTSTNLNLIATLSDIAQNGSTTKLATGNLVGSLRALDPTRSWYDHNGRIIRPYGRFAKDQPLVPGRSYRLDIPLSAGIAKIAAGHSLRLTITTQTAGPCGAIVGRDPCFPTAPQQRTLPGTYKLDLGRSQLNLPLVRN